MGGGLEASVKQLISIVALHGPALTTARHGMTHFGEHLTPHSKTWAYSSAGAKVQPHGEKGTYGPGSLHLNPPPPRVEGYAGSILMLQYQ